VGEPCRSGKDRCEGITEDTSGRDEESTVAKPHEPQITPTVKILKTALLGAKNLAPLGSPAVCLSELRAHELEAICPPPRCLRTTAAKQARDIIVCDIVFLRFSVSSWCTAAVAYNVMRVMGEQLTSSAL
jgi:hypothetical protein